MFTYKDYYDMVATIGSGGRSVYFRHDVDISLDKALQMGERENKMGLTPAIYFILPTSPYYNILSKRDSRKVMMLRDMGHKIGLHYDLSIYSTDNIQEQANVILAQKHILEGVFGEEIIACSCHKPAMGKSPSRELASLLQIAGLHEVNLTMPGYKYISDSGMNWREDYKELIKIHDKFLVNTHPEWYGDKEATWQERIRDCNLDQQLFKLINDEIDSIDRYHEKVLRRD